MLDKLMKFVGLSPKAPSPQDLEHVVGFYITKNTEIGKEVLSFRCPRRTVTETVTTKNEETGKAESHEETKVIGCGATFPICNQNIPVSHCGKREALSVPIDQLPVVNVTFSRQQDGTVKVGGARVLDSEALPGQWDGETGYEKEKLGKGLW